MSGIWRRPMVAPRGWRELAGSLSPRRDGIPLLLALAGWGTLAIALLAGPGVVRSAAVFGFALVCPGVAVVRLLPLRDRLEQGVLAIALGLSLAALTAEAAAIGHLQPVTVLVVLAAGCTAAAVAELVRTRRAT